MTRQTEIWIVSDYERAGFEEPRIITVFATPQAAHLIAATLNSQDGEHDYRVDGHAVNHGTWDDPQDRDSILHNWGSQR